MLLYKWSKGWKPDVFISHNYKIKTTFKLDAKQDVALPVDHQTLVFGLAGVGGEMEPARDADGGCGVICTVQSGAKRETKQGGGKDLLDFLEII